MEQHQGIIKAEGREQGRAEGIEKGKLEDAKKMLDKGYSIADISDITGLSAKDIERLRFHP